jgi:hypothetical protein
MGRIVITVVAALFTAHLAAQTSPSSPPAQTAPEQEAGAPPAEPRTKELEAAIAALKRLRISGYVQGQYVRDESSVDELSGSSTLNRDQFSVRRGRIKLVYAASPTARATVAFDASSSAVVLKDAWIDLIEPWTAWHHTLSVGQFPWPFGYEIGLSSSEREMPERARVVRSLFPGERDRGAMLSGRGLEGRFSYNAAVVNGTGTSHSYDANSGKDLVGRIAGRFGPLALGISGYTGEDLVATTSQPSGARFDKERLGVDFQLTAPLPGLRLRGEYIEAKDRGADAGGWYLYAVQAIGARNQVVVRADDYDPRTDRSGDSVFTIGGAWHFLWDTNTKLTLAWEHPRQESRDVDDDVLTFRVQYRF